MPKKKVMVYGRTIVSAMVWVDSGLTGKALAKAAKKAAEEELAPMDWEAQAVPIFLTLDREDVEDE